MKLSWIMPFTCNSFLFPEGSRSQNPIRAAKPILSYVRNNLFVGGEGIPPVSIPESGNAWLLTLPARRRIRWRRRMHPVFIFEVMVHQGRRQAPTHSPTKVVSNIASTWLRGRWWRWRVGHIAVWAPLFGGEIASCTSSITGKKKRWPWPRSPPKRLATHMVMVLWNFVLRGEERWPWPSFRPKTNFLHIWSWSSENSSSIVSPGGHHPKRPNQRHRKNTPSPPWLWLLFLVHEIMWNDCLDCDCKCPMVPKKSTSFNGVGTRVVIVKFPGQLQLFRRGRMTRKENDEQRQVETGGCTKRKKQEDVQRAKIVRKAKKPRKQKGRWRDSCLPLLQQPLKNCPRKKCLDLPESDCSVTRDSVAATLPQSSED